MYVRPESREGASKSSVYQGMAHRGYLHTGRKVDFSLFKKGENVAQTILALIDKNCRCTLLYYPPSTEGEEEGEKGCFPLFLLLSLLFCKNGRGSAFGT